LRNPSRLGGRPILVALTLCAVIFLAPAQSWARDTPPTTSETLETLNEGFRALYRERTRQVLEALPLVLVVQNHSITAVRGTHRRLYPIPLQRYTEARAIVHAALGFHGLMGNLAQTQPADIDWRRVENFLLDLQRTRQAVGRSALSKGEQAQALQLLDILQQASRSALSTRSFSASDLTAIMRRSEPPMTALAETIGHAHAKAMAAVLQRIQTDATEEEWQNAVAVVAGPMTPRRNNLETAIVAAALGPEHLGSRIFYAENLFSVDAALSYLQVLAGDRELSQNVFDDPQRMWEDLFAPVSRTLVEEDFYVELAQ